MIDFASNVEECRKIQFAEYVPQHFHLLFPAEHGFVPTRYFNKSSRLSMSSWKTDEEDALTRCGHCDNCTRSPELLERLGLTGSVAAWQILRIVQAAGKEVTLTQLYDLARGAKTAGGGDAPSAVKKGRGRAKATLTVDLDRVAGGKCELSREVI